jgi:hypothetical protein
MINYSGYLASKTGGSLLAIIKMTFYGGISLYGFYPVMSSKAVIPKAQISLFSS